MQTGVAVESITDQLVDWWINTLPPKLQPFRIISNQRETKPCKQCVCISVSEVCICVVLWLTHNRRALHRHCKGNSAASLCNLALAGTYPIGGNGNDSQDMARRKKEPKSLGVVRLTISYPLWWVHSMTSGTKQVWLLVVIWIFVDRSQHWTRREKENKSRLS